jgi:Tol biopolymer transport system component
VEGLLVLPQAKSTGRQLTSWKEIAAYLDASVRTVQRWEQQNGLPVHRVLRDKRSAVFALSTELDEWRANRTISPSEAALEEVERSEELATESVAVPEAPPAPVAPSRVSPAPGRRAWMVAVVFLIGTAAAAILFVGWRQRETSAPASYLAERLTAHPGAEYHPVRSPDNKWMVYGHAIGQRSSIVIEAAQGGGRVTRFGESDTLSYSPQWSPDGSRIAFLQIGTHDTDVLLYDVAKGGKPRVLGQVAFRSWVDVVFRSMPSLQWLPNGRELLLLDRAPDSSHQVIRTDLDWTRRSVLLAAPIPWAIAALALSPDRVELRVAKLGPDLRIMGEPRVVPLEAGKQPGNPSWAPNGDLYFVVNNLEVWRMRGERIEKVQISGAHPDFSFSVSADGSFLFGSSQPDVALWLFDPKSQKFLKPLCDSTAMERQARLSVDGKELLFTSDRSGINSVWACDLETETPRQLSFGRPAWNNLWSPDRKRLYYSRFSNEQKGEVVVANGDGSNTRVLATVGENGIVKENAEGTRVYFVAVESLKRRLLSVKPDGSDLRVETEFKEPIHDAMVRSDGKFWVTKMDGLYLGTLRGGLMETQLVYPHRVTMVSRSQQELGVYAIEEVKAGFTGNLAFLYVGEDLKPRQLAPALPEVIGWSVGPKGLLIALRSIMNGDLYVAGPVK